jgi:glutamate/tyrosine decarboxylase-like PLP-dependent enzyme
VTRPDLELLSEALAVLEEGFARLPEAGRSTEPPPQDATAEAAALRAVLLETAARLRDNYPYHHPLYVGQMLKPPHPVARLAYALALTLNPNNHALDGGRASSAMEREAVGQIAAALCGWREPLGHLCSGGTVANFEALWVGRQEKPGLAVAASSQAHYTHARLSAVLGVPFVAIDVDRNGRMDTAALRRALAGGGIGTVVATLGTTATGAVDPLPEIAALARRHGVRVHADAAYGGYFALASNLEPGAAGAFAAIREADSLVIDPHKHGLQPYGCGCVLFRDPSVARHYQHDSPYTYFTTGALHLGEITLECSRAGAAAVALWATHRLLPPVAGGVFARGLEAGRDAALALHRAVAADPRFAAPFPPELDIVVWAVRAERSSAASERARALFDAAARRDLHLALASLPRHLVEEASPVSTWDSDTITCLRACVMKPEHAAWMPDILRRLQAAAADVMPA